MALQISDAYRQSSCSDSWYEPSSFVWCRFGYFRQLSRCLLSALIAASSYWVVLSLLTISHRFLINATCLADSSRTLFSWDSNWAVELFVGQMFVFVRYFFGSIYFNTEPVVFIFSFLQIFDFFEEFLFPFLSLTIFPPTLFPPGDYFVYP